MHEREISCDTARVADADTEFASFKSLILELSVKRCPDEVVDCIVGRLAARPHVALARIWLIGPGDICSQCPLRGECADRSRCLHLVASAGTSQVDPGRTWDRLDGEFRRFPLGVRKVGHVAATGAGVEVPDLFADSHWIADPEWARSEGIASFAGQPLRFGGETLGVLAVFCRQALAEDAMVWLRMVADHAAAAIANARAFKQIEQLRAQLEQENEYLRTEVLEEGAFGDIVGDGAAMRAVKQQIALVAPTDSNVLVLGESGTGKELVAREIHGRSERAGRAMVRVNCASIPRDLYESEFFGHVRGAFTGAVKDRAGRFELADGGTLFLDEVGEIPLPLQGKLLRVLQEGEYERVGEERTRRVDVRILAATNRNLLAEAEAGRFRQDLYYRLNVFPVHVAPLRQRLEDLPMLAAHILRGLARRLGTETPRLSPGAMMQLQRYDWPGNVRELQNVLERASILSRGDIRQVDLPARAARSSVPAATPGETEVVLTDAQMRERERANLRRALRASGGRVAGPSGAAALLGLKPSTLASRLRALGVLPSKGD